MVALNDVRHLWVQVLLLELNEFLLVREVCLVESAQLGNPLVFIFVLAQLHQVQEVQSRVVGRIRIIMVVG